jgi:hypothetical protein
LRSPAEDEAVSRVRRREVTVLFRALLVAAGSEDVEIPPTTEGLAEVGMEGGVCKRPIAETLLRRFLRAPKAEDCGRSMRRP